MSVQMINAAAASAQADRKTGRAESSDSKSPVSFGAALAERRGPSESAAGARTQQTAESKGRQQTDTQPEAQPVHDNKPGAHNATQTETGAIRLSVSKRAEGQDALQGAPSNHDDRRKPGAESEPAGGPIRPDMLPTNAAAASGRARTHTAADTAQTGKRADTALDARQLLADQRSDKARQAVAAADIDRPGDRNAADAAVLAPAAVLQNAEAGRAPQPPRGNALARIDIAAHGGSSKGAARSADALLDAAKAGGEPGGAAVRETVRTAHSEQAFERILRANVGGTRGDSARGSGDDFSQVLTGMHAIQHANPSPSAAASQPASAPAAFSAQLNAPVGSDAWNQALNQQSLRLSHFGDGSAELTLHPRDMGQLQVSLKMGEQAHLHFASPHADVRAAVEAALPQLRQAFADSGMNLGQASVSDQSTSQGSGDPSSDSQGGSTPGSKPQQALDDSAAAPGHITAIAGRTADGGIDLFA